MISTLSIEQEKLCQLALHLTPGIGGRNIRHLMSYLGSAKRVFESRNARLHKVPGIGVELARRIHSKASFDLAEKELLRTEREGIQILFYTDSSYPKRLKQIPDAPAVLFSKGDIDFEKRKIVSIVGTRNATEYGKNVTDDIVSYLKLHDVLIISGLAYGIDIQAHKSALRHGLSTVGVMASGMGTIYPSIHHQVAQQMLEQGGLVTENTFFSKPDAPKFPARNRIIAGLSDAVIVVEAAKKGGALITAEIANDYYRDVFAVPGCIGKTNSEGCNNLIKSHKAHLLNKPEDIDYIMQWNAPSNQEKEQSIFDLSKYSIKEQKIIHLLQDYGPEMMIDDLSQQAELPISQLANVLLSLEFDGLVKAIPGKKFRLN